MNRVAAWSEQTELEFSDYGPELAAFNTTFAAPRVGGRGSRLEVTRYKVPAVRLDDYVNSAVIAPNLVKIDVESAELEVLRGLTVTMAKHRPIITLEVGDMDIEGAPASRESLEFVLKRGYTAFQIEGTELVPHVVKERYNYDNVVLMPQ